MKKFLIISIFLFLLSSCEQITNKQKLEELLDENVILKNENAELVVKVSDLELELGILKSDQEDSKNFFEKKQECNDLFLKDKDKYEFQKNENTKYGSSNISSVVGVIYSLEENTCYVGVNKLEILRFKPGNDISELERIGFVNQGIQDDVQTVAKQDFSKIDLLTQKEEKMENFQQLKSFFE